MSAAGPPSAADLATARMGLRVLFDFPVVPPECVIDFQDRWRESAAIRALITAAGEHTEGGSRRERPVYPDPQTPRTHGPRRDEQPGASVSSACRPAHRARSAAPPPNGIRFGVAVAGFFFRFHKPLIRHG